MASIADAFFAPLVGIAEPACRGKAKPQSVCGPDLDAAAWPGRGPIRGTGAARSRRACCSVQTLAIGSHPIELDVRALPGMEPGLQRTTSTRGHGRRKPRVRPHRRPRRNP